MKNRILVFGAAGMLGHVVAHYLAHIPENSVFRSARTSDSSDILPCDVTDANRVEQVIKEVKPNIVINCAGILIQGSNERIDLAILVNGYFPQFLSRLGRKYDFKLIHISTDCVFSGERGGYSESDFCDGDTPYARTKIIGEVINDIDLTIRTSIIGPELKPDGTGLLNWLLHQKCPMKGYARAFWSGVTTLELAKMIEFSICNNPKGLAHLTMTPKISKYDLLLKINNLWTGNKIEIIPDEQYKCDKSLISNRVDIKFPVCQTYDDMLGQLFDYMNLHRSLYPHYY